MNWSGRPAHRLSPPCASALSQTNDDVCLPPLAAVNEQAYTSKQAKHMSCTTEDSELAHVPTSSSRFPPLCETYANSSSELCGVGPTDTQGTTKHSPFVGPHKHTEGRATPGKEPAASRNQKKGPNLPLDTDSRGRTGAEPNKRAQKCAANHSGT